MVRRLVVVLVVGLGVVAVLLGTWFAFFLLQPEVPPPGVRFYVLQDAYRLGETVVFRLENVGGHTFCTPSIWTWTAQRLVGDEWLRVEAWGHLDAVGYIGPGKVLELSWVAENFSNYERYGAVEVLPGEYRVSFRGTFCDLPPGTAVPEDPALDPDTLERYAYFELVA